MSNPQTPAEWQEAADAASFMLLIDSAKQYGLIEAPEVNTARCETLLKAAKRRGITPASTSELLRRTTS